MDNQIIIVNKERLKKIINKISADGADKLHILADFDKTLIRAFAPDGSKVQSLISILRDEGYLTPDYPDKAKALANHYLAIEKDPNVPKDKKKKAMQEWWSKHFKLLITSRLSKKDIQKAVLSQRIRFRQDVDSLLTFLHKMKIPLVIMSSSGLGIEAIQLYLENQNLLFDNIHVISNEFTWDEQGFITGVKKPIIHSLNKDETMLKDFPFYNAIAKRKNVILLGDSLDDIDMVTGFDYENLLKFGFLNEPTPEKQSKYEKKYDVLILNDGSMEWVNKNLKQMFN